MRSYTAAAAATTGGGHRLRKGLVVAQVGGSLMLLIVAGLFVRSLLNVQRADLGFDPQHVLNIALILASPVTAKPGEEFVDTLLERTGRFPASNRRAWRPPCPWAPQYGQAILRSRALSHRPDSKLLRQGTTLSAPAISIRWASTSFVGVSLTTADKQNSMHVAVINQAMAERFWPGKDPIGKRFSLEREPEAILWKWWAW